MRGEQGWTLIDALHRQILDEILPRFGLAHLGEAERQHLNRVWHRLHAWPDSVQGLTRLKQRYTITTLSNGNIGLLTHMAKRAGLPWDWREKLCQRSQAGSYGKAILAAAVSGCRPIELQMGIVIWRDYDETLQTDMINIFVNGAKVKGQHQGQPWRIIHYVATDDHPLIVATNKLLDQQEEPILHVQIPNPGNFTVEVRRLGKCLWPAHRHSITAYCLRHQWAADIKSTRSADSVSRGLGHVSAKTRRNYGQAQQASKAGALRPLAVTVERGIKPLSTKSPLSKARPSVPEPEMP